MDCRHTRCLHVLQLQGPSSEPWYFDEGHCHDCIPVVLFGHEVALTVEEEATLSASGTPLQRPW